MNLHQTLRAYPTGPLQKLLDEQVPTAYQDGAFSRVLFLEDKSQAADALFRPRGEPQVIKMTCCMPSISLLTACMEKREPVRGLPQVTYLLGECAKDADEITYTGFVLKKLRPPRTRTELLQVNYLRIMATGLENYFSTLGYRGWKGSYLVARVLARRNVLSLRPAFTEISKVIKEEHAVLDLHQDGNILFSEDGNICLSDPVALTCSELPPAVPHPSKGFRNPMPQESPLRLSLSLA